MSRRASRNGCNPSVRRQALGVVLAVIATASSQAHGGGLIAYEFGTAEVGLASAGYSARAQDASTAFTNPAGLTRLDGNQSLASGQLLWANTKFSIGSGTSPALGGDDGGYAVGDGGWFLGGGGFYSHTLSPNLKFGFALTGNFGAPLDYGNDWVGRYYVQSTTLLGASLVPSLAWKVNDKLSLGASLNAMYGIYRENVAINNVNPLFGDGQLKLSDETWAWGATLGMLYEFDSRTRVGVTWTSQMSLDFRAPMRFSNLAPGLSAALDRAGLLNATLDLGMKVPQQVMASLYTQVDDRWALLGSVGWQQWSKFGRVQVGIDNATNPVSLTAALPFDDTWHFAVGAQYRMSGPWTLNFGVAYDSGFQSTSNVSPLMPVASAWRFGFGEEQQLGKNAFWGFAIEYLYGGSLDTNIRSTRPVAAGGRGDLVGSFNNTGTVFFAAYYNWKFGN